MVRLSQIVENHWTVELTNECYTGTPAQKSGNIQNRHSTESDPSENASVSGDEKHNGSGQDTGSSSLSASEETSF
jgi:hypothetical protein